MAAVDQASTTPSYTTSTEYKTQEKTIFSLLSNLKQAQSKLQQDSDQLDSEDLVILRRNPNTNQNSINKSAYLKLHKNTNTSSNRDSSVERIKENFEPNKPKPVPKVRRSKVTKSQVILPNKQEQKPARYSLNIDKSRKDVNSNHLTDRKEDLSSEEEYVTIVRRSDSEESIAKIREELSAFTLDPNMEKKKKNNFRRIFSVFSNKDRKKKSEEKNKSQNKDNAGMYSENFQNESHTFTRQSPYRHTTGGDSYSTKQNPSTVKLQRSDSDAKVPNPYVEQQLEREYAQKHIDQFNKFKESFENVSSHVSNSANKERYTTMDKPIIKNHQPNNSYMHMPDIRKYIDTSSSASTSESDRSNPYQSESFKPNQQRQQTNTNNIEERNHANSLTRINDSRRDTPPRLLETKQDVRLVNPKALIPINSERALPNPYQNVHPRSPGESPQQSLTRMSQTDSSPYQTMNSPRNLAPNRPNFNETYGTVFDSLENSSQRSSSRASFSPKDQQKVPRSPSLEPSKLKLPPNREIVPLSPRVRSPIPSEYVSTEKLIATELLKTRRSPVPVQKISKNVSPTHRRLDLDLDYPDNIDNISKDSLIVSTDNLSAKPPPGSRQQHLKLPMENGRMGSENYRLSQASPSTIENLYRVSQASPVGSADKIITNAQVHINSPVNRTPTPNNSMHNLSLSPVRSTNGSIRPSTPLGMKRNESPKTPQKEDMRKSVEAYYWKEIKKMKDQENYDLYMLQMQYGNMYPYGYAEEPASVRRSRSLSPSANRNGRRSLSLPRDVKGPMNPGPGGRLYANAIPENRAVTHQMHPRSIQQLQFQQQQEQQKYFTRNTPERRTVDGTNFRKTESNTDSLYKPIFKRGSLNVPVQQTMDDTLKRKVSFSGSTDQNVQSWPTKNGFTKSPPQRRIDRNQSQGSDDVFMPNIPNDNRYQYQTNQRNEPIKEALYYNSKRDLPGPNGEPFYISKSNQNPLYMPQRQIAEGPYSQEQLYVSKNNQNPLYSQRIPQQEEVLYGQPRDAIPSQAPAPRLVRHGSIQMGEEMYRNRMGPRRTSYQNNNMIRPGVSSTPNPSQEVQYLNRAQQPTQLRREIILNDEIFGQFGGYVSSPDSRTSQPQSVYSSRQSIAEYTPGRPVQRQVSVNNKVCDIYGQIHDVDNPRFQTGVIMGQLQPNPGSPMAARSSYSQLPTRQPFVRNSRLTASANDMHHRSPNIVHSYPPDGIYGRIESSQLNNNDGYNRPLPPIPRGRKGVVRNLIVSDQESGSDISEIQRIMNNNQKTNNRGLYGK